MVCVGVLWVWGSAMADIFISYAKALAACGRSQEASDVLARGRQRLEQVMRGIADLEWRERFVNAVPAHRPLMGS